MEKKREGVKNASKTLTTNVRDIIADAKDGLTDDQLVTIPNDHAIEQQISRVRKVHRNTDLDSQTLKNFIVPDDYKISDSGELFLQYDSSTGIRCRSRSRSPSRLRGRHTDEIQSNDRENERILIFCSTSAIRVSDLK